MLRRVILMPSDHSHIKGRDRFSIMNAAQNKERKIPPHVGRSSLCCINEKNESDRKVSFPINFQTWS